MSRFYVSKECVKGNTIYISGKEAHHILNVMRLKVSDEVVVFDGTGKEYAGVVRKTGRKSLSLDIRQIREAIPDQSYSIALIQAIPKKDRMDYIVQKATELGVSSILPVTTARTIPAWNDTKKASIVERWRKITMEAAKQCGRSDIPEVSPIVPFEEIASSRPKAAGLAMTSWDYDLKLIAALSDKAVKLKDALRTNTGNKVAIAIGPEGDFTPEELDAAVVADFKIVNLGSRVLKSDTAGLAALAIINYEYGK